MTTARRISFKVRYKLRVPNVNTVIKCCFGGSVSTVIEEEKIKGIRIGKEETKLYYMQIKGHVENPKGFTETARTKEFRRTTR